jgi:hypothetical protein
MHESIQNAMPRTSSLKLFVVSVILATGSLKGFEFVPAIEEYIKPELKNGPKSAFFSSSGFALTKF